MLVELDRTVWHALVDHAERARPAEACGLLASRPEAGGAVLRVQRYRPLTNTAASAEHFRVDPVEFARAERALRGQGLRVCGFFHSHPGAGPEPSVADTEAAWPAMLQVILGMRGAGCPRARAWFPDARGLRALKLRVVLADYRGCTSTSSTSKMRSAWGPMVPPWPVGP